MTEPELLAILLNIKMPQRYYELCAKYPSDPENKKPKGTKKDIVEVAKSLDMKVTSEKNDRSYTFGREPIGKMIWKGTLAIHNGGYIELLVSGKPEEGRKWTVGSNFAVLSNLAMKTENPDHLNDPPFPRPHYNNPDDLRAIVKEFILIIQDLKEVLQKET